MKKMTILNLTIISLTEKKARKIEFDANLTVVSSQREDGSSVNRNGKSLILKSIYYAFGADLNRYTTNWKELNLCTIIRFDLDGKIFKLFRHGNSFVLYNLSEEEVYKFYNIAEIKEFFVDFFDFNIKLPLNNSKDEAKTSHLYPGGIFLPFYIDQDIGWLGEWRSFSDVTFYKNWCKEILFYHTGIKPKRYYELLEDQTKYTEDNKNNKLKFKTLESIYEEQIKRNGDVLDINLNMEEFKAEIQELTAVLNRQLIKKNTIKDELLKLYNEKFDTEENYNNAVLVLKELDKDIGYINTNILEEYIKCPTCGTTHENSVSNRYMMYQEIENCENIISNYLEKKESLLGKIDEKESILLEVDEDINTINAILLKKRNEVTFDEVIKSKGARELLNSLSFDMKKLDREIEGIDGKLKSITAEKTKISKGGKDKHSTYSALINEYLTLLDVVDINVTDAKKIGERLKSNGSDLSRAVLAQCFAYYNIIKKFTASVVCPIVVDTPLQQDQGSEKTDLIFDFLIDSQPKGSQVIVATTETHGKEINGKIIKLLDKMALLKVDEYQQCTDEMNDFMKLLIS